MFQTATSYRVNLPIVGRYYDAVKADLVALAEAMKSMSDNKKTIADVYKPFEKAFPATTYTYSARAMLRSTLWIKFGDDTARQVSQGGTLCPYLAQETNAMLCGKLMAEYLAK